MSEQIEVFLGGTCNGSQWREVLKPMLKVNYFDPIVEDWNEAAMLLEIEKRKTCDYVLYVITPLMVGFYSIAEAVEDSNKRPYSTLFCYLNEDNGSEFTYHQLKSLKSTAKLIEDNGSKCFNSLEELAEFLNKRI